MLFLTQAFMVSEGRCEQVAMESVPQLVADMTNSVKFSGAKTGSLHTVIKHLLTLCDNMQPAHRSSIDAVSEKLCPEFVVRLFNNSSIYSYSSSPPPRTPRRPWLRT
jgi:hypothetical protein